MTNALLDCGQNDDSEEDQWLQGRSPTSYCARSASGDSDLGPSDERQRKAATDGRVTDLLRQPPVNIPELNLAAGSQPPKS